MKKLLFSLLFIFSFNIIVQAEKLDVSLTDCVDGDTVKVLLNNNKITLRFLSVDTPEIKTNDYFAQEAKEYTCNTLKNTSNIQIEYDEKSTKTDKYNRHLVWIYYDNKLLQADLIKKGYAKTAYFYGDYKYNTELKILEEKAKLQKIGIWHEEKIDYFNYAIMGIIIILIIIVYYKKPKKAIKELKKLIK